MDTLSGLSVLVTGGAGFVGSHLVEALLNAGAFVAVYDNGSTGRWKFLDQVRSKGHWGFVQWTGDLLQAESLPDALHGKDLVVHLAANADIRHGADHPDRDFEVNVHGTQILLRHMRDARIEHIVFASTGAVYGEQTAFPTPEDAPFPIQNSLYGASKIAAEALIAAYCATFNMQAFIFRFTPMLGERYSHGHIFDFVKNLRANPRALRVLGTGQERKYSLYAADAMRGVLCGILNGNERVNIFNVGSDESYSIIQAVKWVATKLIEEPKVEFTSERWVGDNPNMYLDASRLKSLGWMPMVGARESISRTVQYLIDNPWLLERES